jgi:hypothetical protein
MIKSIFDEKFDEGVAVGEARGEAKEKTNTGRDMVLTFVQAKFGRVPKEVKKAILAMTDPIALKSLAAHAGHCETIDEFAEALK